MVPLPGGSAGGRGDPAPCLLSPGGLCGIVTIPHLKGTSSGMITRAQTGVGYRWDFVGAGSTAPLLCRCCTPCTVCSLPYYTLLSWSGNLI